MWPLAQTRLFPLFDPCIHLLDLGRPPWVYGIDIDCIPADRSRLRIRARCKWRLDVLFRYEEEVFDAGGVWQIGGVLVNETIEAGEAG